MECFFLHHRREHLSMANQIKLCSSKQKVKKFTNLRWIGCKDKQERGNWNRAIKCCEGKPQEVKAQKGSDAHLGHWIITRALGLLSLNTNWHELCTSSHEKRSKFNFRDYPRMELNWEFNYSTFLGSFCFISHTRCLSIHFPECMESNSSFKNKSINYIRKFLCLVLCVFILKEHIWSWRKHHEQWPEIKQWMPHFGSQNPWPYQSTYALLRSQGWVSQKHRKPMLIVEPVVTGGATINLGLWCFWETQPWFSYSDEFLHLYSITLTFLLDDSQTEIKDPEHLTKGRKTQYELKIQSSPMKLHLEDLFSFMGLLLLKRMELGGFKLWCHRPSNTMIFLKIILFLQYIGPTHEKDPFTQF